jgi:hypothetical protein
MTGWRSKLNHRSGGPEWTRAINLVRVNRRDCKSRRKSSKASYCALACGLEKNRGAAPERAASLIIQPPLLVTCISFLAYRLAQHLQGNVRLCNRMSARIN